MLKIQEKVVLQTGRNGLRNHKGKESLPTGTIGKSFM